MSTLPGSQAGEGSAQTEVAAPAGLRDVLGRVASVLGLGVLLGAVAGVVWELLWTPPTGAAWEGGWIPDKAGVTAVFGATGWFVVVGLVYGIVYGCCVALLVRGREVLTLACLTVGALLAARVTAWVGALLGPADPATVAAEMEELEPLVLNLELSSGSTTWWPEIFGSSALLAPALGALVAACVIWFSSAPLRRRRPFARGARRQGVHTA